MSQHKYCVIFPLDHPLKWTADYQKQTHDLVHQHYLDNVVLYHAYEKRKTWRNLLSLDFWQELSAQIKSSSHQKELNFVPLHFLPFERFSLIYSLNKQLSFLIISLIGYYIFKPKKLVFWLFHPGFYTLVKWPRHIFRSKSILFYDCVDFFTLINQEEEMLLRKNEQGLLKAADLMTVNSVQLKQLYGDKRSKIQLIPTGFRHRDFQSFTHFAAASKDKKVIITYIGAINYRLDFPLLFSLLDKNPELDFIFVGPIYTETDNGPQDIRQLFDQLKRYSNFTHFDYIKPDELPPLLIKSHLGIIPYDLSIALNLNCNPVKLLEYYYFGLPVISTDIPSLSAFASRVLRVGKTATSWQNHIAYFLKHPPTKSEQHQQRKMAIENSWENRVAKIYQHLGAFD